MSGQTLSEAAVHILTTADPDDKTDLTARYAAGCWERSITEIGTAEPPDRPARPAKPDLLPPGKMPRRSFGSDAGRAAFIHAIAHIELNAIDLAWDIVARFTEEDMPKAFYDDWVGIAADEARHFAMLNARLASLGFTYGDFPGHDGLWEVAQNTTDDLAARLALVPMVLEARGLDTAPDAANRFRSNGDIETADILDLIAREEIPHVAAGTHWFQSLCERDGCDPVERFQDFVRSRFRTNLKAPFNDAARREAGMSKAYYLPLVE